MIEILWYEYLEYAVTALILAGLFLICSIKPLAILQQSGYKNTKLFSWYAHKDNMLVRRYCILAILLVLATGILGIATAFGGVAIAFRISLLPFPIFCIWFYLAERKYALKLPYQKTPRFQRLAVCNFVVLAIWLYLFVATFNLVAKVWKNDLYGVWRYVALSFTPFFLPVTSALASLITGGFERLANKRYIKKATEKLAQVDCIKIGITGSFAKTSVKNILTTMLEEKYKVLSTPQSYNTPMGIAKCIHEYDGEPYEVFIAEMGARNKGDIQELCEMVKPKYSILTGICEQHLESFGSIDKVIATKAEIIAGTDKDGKVVVGREENTEKAVALSAENAPEILWVDESMLREISVDCTGTACTLVYEGKLIRIHTRLLGKYTPQNVAIAARLALELGVTPEQIESACEKMSYVSNRLKVSVQAGVVIIDDSYNANVRGIEQSIEVLKSFPGRKIIVTPGMIELGVLEKSANARLGELLVGVDEIVLIGGTLAGVIKEGYLAAGGNPDKVQIAPTSSEVQFILSRILRTDDVILFLNDLPDVY